MLKRKINRIKVLILLILSITIYSCEQIEKKEYKFNGIYQTSQKGLNFKYYNDTINSLMIDTIPVINYSDFEKVEMYYQIQTDKPVLSIELNEIGRNKFAEVTKENIGKPLAVILNDKLLSAPIVRIEIPDGLIKLSGIEIKTLQEIIAHFEASK